MMRHVSEIIRSRIAARMKEMDNMSQAALAESAGITRAGINQILKGPRTPTLPVLRKIASVLGVSIDYLTGVSEAPDVEAAIKSDPNQLDFFRNFQGLGPEDQKKMKKIMEAFKKED